MKNQVDYKLYLRNVLLSTGEFTKEAVIDSGESEIFESAPSGLTLGLNEASLMSCNNIENMSILSKAGLLDSSQELFDVSIAAEFTSQVSTALSMVFLRYLAQKENFLNNDLYKYIAKAYNKQISFPNAIFNILNGGKHAGNGLDFCEFMVVPKGKNILDNIKIASEIYLDLRNILEQELGKNHTLVGREGGFAPNISDIELALGFICQAINVRNSGKCGIAIDVAANNFSKHLIDGEKSSFEYLINDKIYSTETLLSYYENLIKKFPEIVYLEDPFNENDIEGWRGMNSILGNKILVVADDLTVSNIEYLEKYHGCFNACILKINQIGNMTGLMKAYDFCVSNKIKTIISQRSGETDSDIIAHMSVGLGSDFIKAGAPARERIIKYNTLIRLWHRYNTNNHGTKD